MSAVCSVFYHASGRNQLSGEARSFALNGEGKSVRSVFSVPRAEISTAERPAHLFGESK